MLIILVHMPLAAPLPHAAGTGQCPSPHRCSACYYLVSYIQAEAQTVSCKQWRTDNNNNRAKNAPPLPFIQRRNKNA